MTDFMNLVGSLAFVMLVVSLLIGILTHIAFAVVGLPGANLLWGLKALFGSFDPRLAALAEAVVQDPLISHSFLSRLRKRRIIGRLLRRWTWASDIRYEELERALDRVSAELKTKDPETARVIDSLLAELDPEAVRKIERASALLRRALPGGSLPIDAVVKLFKEAKRLPLGKLEGPFSNVMDRVSDRLLRQSRLCTALFAFAIAFLTHLDFFALVELRLPETRASLTSSTSALRAEAAAVMTVLESTPQTLPATTQPQAYAVAFTALKQKRPAATQGLEDPPAFDGLPAALAWLEPRLKGDEAAKKSTLAEYRMLVSTELSKRAEAIRTRLEASGWQLIPSPYPGSIHEGTQEVLGTLLSGAFLSLGAPFWFNALKTLSNLRPVLASRQAKPAATSG